MLSITRFPTTHPVLPVFHHWIKRSTPGLIRLRSENFLYFSQFNPCLPKTLSALPCLGYVGLPSPPVLAAVLEVAAAIVYDF
jgi:hypothetical protein